MLLQKSHLDHCKHSGRGLQTRNCIKNGSDFNCIRVATPIFSFQSSNPGELLDQKTLETAEFHSCTTQSRPTPLVYYTYIAKDQQTMSLINSPKAKLSSTKGLIVVVFICVVATLVWIIVKSTSTRQPGQQCRQLQTPAQSQTQQHLPP